MRFWAIGLFIAGSVAGAPAGAPDQVHLAWVEEPSTTLTVVWHTADAGAPAEVQYRPAGSKAWLHTKGGPRNSGTAGQLHEATLRGLKPATRYEYRVSGSAAAWSDTYTTRTAPPRGPATFDVVFVSDTGLIGRTDGLTVGTQHVMDEIVKLDPLLVLLGGDYASFDKDKRYGTLEKTIDAWFNQMQPVGVKAPMMPTYGNHEIMPVEGYDAWAARFATPEGYDHRQNYSFDVGNVHFISIMAAVSSRKSRSLEGDTPQATRDWIVKDAAEARRAGMMWILPYMHVASFSDGSNHPSNFTLREQIGPVMEKIGAKIVMTCHDQSYERTYPITGVPDHIHPTSNSKSCYTMEDGVSWVKVSPGGKMSDISRTFAQWLTNPAPPLTAVRDNTMNHFARLRVSPNALVVEIFGVPNDDKPAAVIDTFRYSLRGCGSEQARIR